MYLQHLAILSLCLSMSGCAASTPFASDADARSQVFATEAAFAKTMADRDRNAFSDFIADDAVFFAGTEPLRGKQQVVDWWARYYATPDAPFSWEPEEVEILDSGNLAYSTGPVRDPDGNVVGRFNSIWRHDGSGSWHVIFDKGSDACDCTPP